ncbi:hypothetical protein AB0D86_38560 [Streptomyces sp. NPDC048324]|uniref:hypothetical protein n=1 Tax=Streptomyces sp. NPDC048324 TaxID=3157205 RepID=UPI003444ACD6
MTAACTTGNTGTTGAGFKVEISELDGLVRELHRSHEEMRSALNSLRDTGPKTTASKELDNAYDEFHDSWDDGITIGFAGKGGAQ